MSRRGGGGGESGESSQFTQGAQGPTPHEWGRGGSVPQAHTNTPGSLCGSEQSPAGPGVTPREEAKYTALLTNTANKLLTRKLAFDQITCQYRSVQLSRQNPTFHNMNHLEFKAIPFQQVLSLLIQIDKWHLQKSRVPQSNAGG